jgi:hypothetical protein
MSRSTITALAAALALVAGSAAVADARPCTAGCDDGGSTIPGHPPSPKPTPEPDTRMRHVEVKLVSVTANNTEDALGEDEFYMMGSAGSGAQDMKAVVTDEVGLTDHDTAYYNQTLLSADLPGDAPLDLGFTSFDHDQGQVLQHVPEVLRLVGGACLAAAPFDPTHFAAACAAAAPAIAQIAAWISPYAVDADDQLDTWGVHYGALSTFAIGTTDVRRPFANGPGLDHYDYLVDFQVTVTLK